MICHSKKCHKSPHLKPSQKQRGGSLTRQTPQNTPEEPSPLAEHQLLLWHAGSTNRCSADSHFMHLFLYPKPKGETQKLWKQLTAIMAHLPMVPYDTVHFLDWPHAGHIVSTNAGVCRLVQGHDMQCWKYCILCMEATGRHGEARQKKACVILAATSPAATVAVHERSWHMNMMYGISKQSIRSSSA